MTILGEILRLVVVMACLVGFVGGFTIILVVAADSTKEEAE